MLAKGASTSWCARPAGLTRQLSPNSRPAKCRLRGNRAGGDGGHPLTPAFQDKQAISVCVSVSRAAGNLTFSRAIGFLLTGEEDEQTTPYQGRIGRRDLRRIGVIRLCAGAAAQYRLAICLVFSRWRAVRAKCVDVTFDRRSDADTVELSPIGRRACCFDSRHAHLSATKCSACQMK
jgi:hypothetical protein